MSNDAHMDRCRFRGVGNGVWEVVRRNEVIGQFEEVVPGKYCAKVDAMHYSGDQVELESFMDELDALVCGGRLRGFFHE